MMKVLRSKGFTLVELIVCIAIIAVLSAVLIPTVSGFVGSAQEAACELQRSQVKEQLAAIYIYNGEISDPEGEAEKIGAKCPSCGESYKVSHIVNSLFAVSCPKHTAGGYYGVGINKPYFDAGECLNTSLEDMIKSMNGGSSSVDSNCPNSNGFTKDMLAYLNKTGYKLSASNISYWAARALSSTSNSKNYVLYWTQVEMSENNDKKNALAMSYNLYYQTYSVVVMKIKSTNLNGGATYYIFDAKNVNAKDIDDEYSYSKYITRQSTSGWTTSLTEPTGENAKDFSKVMAYYNNVKAEIAAKSYNTGTNAILIS